MHVVFSDQSLADLREIWDFLADSSEDAASRTVRELVRAGNELSTMSARFAESAVPGFRLRNVRRWAIVYRVLPTHVEIIRIVHGGRSLRELRRR